MTVTARLSQKFYERLGEEVANELVDWFNAVDATYRNDLRELNELNFQRFDAKVEQRLAELRAHLDANWERRFAESDTKWERRFAELERSVGRLEATFERRLGASSSSLIKWMFGFWALTLSALAGMLFYLR
jgi:hypothetical protein